MAVKKKSNIFNILEDSGTSEKANINTLMAIVEEFGAIPNTMYVDDDLKKGWDYEKVSKLAFHIARQSDPETKLDVIREQITHHNIYSLVGHINKSLTLEVPPDLQELILASIEFSRLDVIKRKLNTEQIKELVQYAIDKEWITEKDFEKATDEKAEPPKN